MVSGKFRCISDDPLRVGGDRGRVVALKLVVSAPFRFVSDDPLGAGDGGLIVALKLLVLAPFRFVGFVATLNVMTLTVGAGCRGAKTSSFGTISTS